MSKGSCISLALLMIYIIEKEWMGDECARRFGKTMTVSVVQCYEE